MRTIVVIAGREARSLFQTPLAWLILAGSTFSLAWVFLWFVQRFLSLATRLPASAHQAGVTALVAAPAMFWTSLVLSVLTPLIAMRLIAEEKRNGTIALLRSAPVSTTAIVLGKFLALLVFLWLVVIVATAMPLSLILGTRLDYGRLAAGVLGLGLLAGTFGAISLFMSTLTRQPVLAALGGFGALLLLWIFNLAGSTSGIPTFSWLAFESHLAWLFRGEVRTEDVAYFVILTALFLCLSVWKLDAERLGG